MNRLFRYLKQPHPAVSKRWHIVVVASLTVLFVLGIFQPFGIGQMIEANYLVLLGFVLVTVVCLCIIAYIFPLIFKRFYTGEWTVGKNMLNGLFIVLSISLGNTCYYYIVMHERVSFSWENAFFSFLFYFVVTLLVSLVPITIITFLQHNQMLKQHLEEAQELNRKLAAKVVVDQQSYTSEPIILSGNTKESIKLHPEQLIYLEAYGNYVKVNYIEGDAVKQKLLRATIKQIEDELASISYIIRCHRAFLVNIQHVSSVKGNSQGYRLLFAYPTEEVPVSRAYAKDVRGMW